MEKKKISIVTACYNEEENIEELYKRVRNVMETKLKDYDYEHIFIDNASEDRTVEILKKIAEKDKRVKIIVNSRNFGHIRSPVYGLLQAKGESLQGRSRRRSTSLCNLRCSLPYNARFRHCRLQP